MAEYLYKVSLAKPTAHSSGFPPSNDADTTDFEDNHKSNAVKVSEVIITDTTIITEKTYTDFKALLTGGIDWDDVIYTDSHHGIYELSLLSGSAL